MPGDGLGEAVAGVARLQGVLEAPHQSDMGGPVHVSIGNYQVKPETYDELVSFANSLLPELKAIKGCRHFAVVRTGNDTAMSLSFYESRQDAEAAAPAIQRIFSRMAEFITVPPTRDLYDTDVFASFQAGAKRTVTGAKPAGRADARRLRGTACAAGCGALGGGATGRAWSAALPGRRGR